MEVSAGFKTDPDDAGVRRIGVDTSISGVRVVRVLDQLKQPRELPRR
jgi:hypothetical protein